jgi:hypothetical protein
MDNRGCGYVVTLHDHACWPEQVADETLANSQIADSLAIVTLLAARLLMSVTFCREVENQRRVDRRLVGASSDCQEGLGRLRFLRTPWPPLAYFFSAPIRR